MNPVANKMMAAHLPGVSIIDGGQGGSDHVE